jgi:hypothetical protein
MKTSPSQYKLRQLELFVSRICEPEECIQAVMAIGSVAAGRAGPESDIDAIIFMDPLDLYAVPAESVWSPDDGSFHGIFSPEARHPIPCSSIFCGSLGLWQATGFEWPEPRLAELASGKVVFDRHGAVGELIQKRSHYAEKTQRQKLDEAVTWLDQLLAGDTCAETWSRYGPAIALDRLNSAYDWLVQALFALNRRWRPWRNREMSTLIELAWLPADFHEQALVAAAGSGHDRTGYEDRVHALDALLNGVNVHLSLGYTRTILWARLLYAATMSQAETGIWRNGCKEGL